MRKVRLGDNPGPLDIYVREENSDEENIRLDAQLQQQRDSNDPLYEADLDANFDALLSQASDNVEGDSNKKDDGKKEDPMEDDEDLHDLDAFLDNLSKPVPNDLL